MAFRHHKWNFMTTPRWLRVSVNQCRSHTFEKTGYFTRLTIAWFICFQILTTITTENRTRCLMNGVNIFKYNADNRTRIPSNWTNEDWLTALIFTLSLRHSSIALAEHRDVNEALNYYSEPHWGSKLDLDCQSVFEATYEKCSLLFTIRYVWVSDRSMGVYF